MTDATANIFTTPSEQMFFGGAPVAHVVLYYERSRDERLAKLRPAGSAREYRRTVDWLASMERERRCTPPLMQPAT